MNTEICYKVSIKKEQLTLTITIYELCPLNFWPFYENLSDKNFSESEDFNQWHLLLLLKTD